MKNSKSKFKNERKDNINCNNFEIINNNKDIINKYLTIKSSSINPLKFKEEKIKDNEKKDLNKILIVDSWLGQYHIF